MLKEEFKKLVYCDFESGLSVSEVKFKYKDCGIPRYGNIIGGCHSYYESSKNKVVKNVHKEKTVNKVDQMIDALDVILNTLDEDNNIEMSAIEYIGNKLLHDFEKDLTEREVLDLARKLAEVRRKRRAIKQNMAFVTSLEEGLKKVKGKEGIRYLKNEMAKRRQNIDSITGDKIANEYSSKIKHLQNKEIRSKISTLEKELNL